MNYSIRPYNNNNDYSEIVSWWNTYSEPAPIIGMMIEDGTFILELNGISALTLTIFLTQSKEIAYLEGFCKNPKFKNINLEEYTTFLLNHIYKYAYEKGYKRIIAYCKVDKLKEKYKRLGLIQVMNNLSGFNKEIL